MPGPAGLAAALAFFRAFPDAESFNILILTAEKQAVLSRPQASPDLIHQSLPTWLQMSHAHLFVRPNFANLVQVCREYGDACFLASQVLTETFSGDFQLWPDSAKVTQVGRLPGSVNVKPGKGNPVALLHSYLQDMDEAFFLQLVPSPKLCVDAAGAKVLPQAAAAQSSVDRSRQDWRMAAWRAPSLRQARMLG